MDARLVHPGDFSARRRSGSQPSPQPRNQGAGVPRLPPALNHQLAGGRSGSLDASRMPQPAMTGPSGLSATQRRPIPQGGSAAAVATLRPRPSAAAGAQVRWRCGNAAHRSSTALPCPAARSPQPTPNSARGRDWDTDATAADRGPVNDPAPSPASGSRVPAPPPLPNPARLPPGAGTTAPAAVPTPAALPGPLPRGTLSRHATCPPTGSGSMLDGRGALEARSGGVAQGAAPLALRAQARAVDDASSSGSDSAAGAKGADGAGKSGASAAAIEALRRTFECPVCLELLWHPVCTPCGHHFCRGCLEVSLQRAGRRCPACRAPCHIDAQTHPESTLASEAVQSLWPDAAAQRSSAPPLLPQPSVVLPVVVRAEVAFPGQPVRVRLLDSRYRTQLLQRLLSSGAGRFLLLPAPATPAALPTKGAVGVCCRVDDCSPRRGHVVATAMERMRVGSAWQERDGDGDGLCYARCDPLGDTDELQTSALAAAWRLRRRLASFFDSQHPLLKGHVVADAGEEPPLPPLPPEGQQDGTVPRGATRYSFWAAAVLGVFAILPDGARRGVLTEQLCARRCALLQAGTRHLPTRASRSPPGVEPASGDRSAAGATVDPLTAPAP
eukprot:TRINITY_DN5701_c0_g2_i1.p1 TRINITY_DN5701_c0_g2~~TRINITY_DN5701_c0_g2_i1.p1  ORF type:complete len:631 (+),score=162.92 TRINITY_DN5701_c0_g2_i1:56-1894(+)